MKFSVRGRLLFSVLLLGLVLRLLSAWYVWGPQALDDYLDSILPAWQWANGTVPNLHDYRSPLFIWILGDWIRFGQSLGITQGLFQVRWVYVFLALNSLLAIFGVDLIVRSRKSGGDEEGYSLQQVLPLYLMAAYGLIPFISTRAFLESFSLPYVTLGFGWLEVARRSSTPESRGNFILGFVLLGFASLIRFQVGIIYVGYMVALLLLKEHRGWRQGFVIGLFLILAEVLIDKIYGRQAFGTLIAYAHANSRPEDYGVMPWYNTWTTWLGFLFFPFSFLICRNLKLLWQEYKVLIGVLFLFLFIHCLAPHKEERFLYPILGLSFVLWGYLLANSLSSKWVKWVYLPIFWALNTLLLAAGCLVNTQVGEVGPPAEISLRSDSILYLDYDSLVGQGWMWQLFIRPPSALKKVSEPLSRESIELQIREASKTFAYRGFAVLAGQESDALVLEKLAQKPLLDGNCESLKESSSIIDELVYRANPKNNSRRRPTWYLTCWRP